MKKLFMTALAALSSTNHAHGAAAIPAYVYSTAVGVHDKINMATLAVLQARMIGNGYGSFDAEKGLSRKLGGQTLELVDVALKIEVAVISYYPEAEMDRHKVEMVKILLSDQSKEVQNFIARLMHVNLSGAIWTADSDSDSDSEPDCSARRSYSDFEPARPARHFDIPSDSD